MLCIMWASCGISNLENCTRSSDRVVALDSELRMPEFEWNCRVQCRITLCVFLQNLPTSAVSLPLRVRSYIALQKGRRGADYALKRLYNCTVGWVLPGYDLGGGGGSEAAGAAGGESRPGRSASSSSSVVVPLNAAKLVNDLFAIHGSVLLLAAVLTALLL